MKLSPAVVDRVKLMKELLDMGAITQEEFLKGSRKMLDLDT